jgi:hypothetical protein
MKLLQRWKQTAIHNKALVLTSAIVACGTLFYAVAAIFQIYLMDSAAKNSADQTEKLIVEMRRQSQSMKDMAEANKKAVELATQSLKTTQELFRLDQRAWISVIKGSLIEPLDAKKIFFRFVIKNSGKTPALRVRFNNKAWIISSTGQILTKNEKKNNREVSYGPGEEEPIFLVWGKPLSQQQIDDMQSGRIIFFVEVELIYFDIYDAKKPHHTRACFYYNPKVGRGGLMFCENGPNFMD